MPTPRRALAAASLLAALATVHGAWLRAADSLHEPDDFYVGTEGVCGAQCIDKLMEADALSDERCEGQHLGASEGNDLSWVKLSCVAGRVRKEDLRASLHGRHVEHPHADGGVAAVKVWAVHT